MLATFHASSPRNDRTIRVLEDKARRLTVFMDVVAGTAGSTVTLVSVVARIDSTGVPVGYVQRASKNASLTELPASVPLAPSDVAKIPSVARWVLRKCYETL